MFSSKIKTFLLVTLILSQAVSCRWITGAGMPKYAFTKPPIPEGATPAFKKGWEDGCRNAMYARGNVLYRNLNKFHLDPNLIDNSEYMFGIRRSYGFCAFNFAGIDGPNNSPDSYIFTGYDTWFSAGSINDTGFTGNSLATPFAPNDSTKEGINATFSVFSGSVLTGNPLWAGGSSGQIFGQ